MTSHDTWKSTLAGGQLVLGLVLFLAPWIFGFSGETTPAWSAWITGAVIALVGASALAGYLYPASWANLVLGVWAITAPWILGFSALAEATWSHAILGVLSLLAAGATLWLEHESPTSAHA